MEDQNYKKNFLEKIRSLDHQTKINLVIILSIISLFFVIYIWGKYFNFIIADLANKKNNQNIEESGFVHKIKISGAFVSQIIGNLFNYFNNNVLKSFKEYNISK